VTAEVEVLSSTSEEVCELWSGSEIVRVTGRAEIKELVHEIGPKRSSLPGECELMSVGSAESSKRYRVVPLGGRHYKRDPTEHDGWLQRFAKGAPNLTLNTDRAIASAKERRICAAIGLVLQVGLFASWTLTTYHWGLGRAGKFPPQYGCPCALVGAASVFGGLLLCAYVVEDVTAEVSVQPADKLENYEVLRIQKACTTGSQKFGAYLLRNAKGKPAVFMCRRVATHDPGTAIWKNEVLTTAGTALSCFGFLVQFIGLRTLHWSATIAQLIVMAVMTAIRSWLRRGLLREPRVENLREGSELSDAAFKLGKCAAWGLSTSAPLDDLPVNSTQNLNSDPTMRQLRSNLCVARNVLLDQSDQLVRLRFKLGRITEWEDECSEWATKVTRATDSLFYKMQSMAKDSDRSFSLKKDLSLSLAWAPVTYLTRYDPVTQRQEIGLNVFDMNPDRIFEGETHLPKARGSRRRADYYSTILSLWWFTIRVHTGQSETSELPYARIVGRVIKGDGCVNDIARWLSDPLWKIPLDDLGSCAESNEQPGTKKQFDQRLSFGRTFSHSPIADHG
jgi:hypothetical protein